MAAAGTGRADDCTGECNCCTLLWALCPCAELHSTALEEAIGVYLAAKTCFQWPPFNSPYYYSLSITSTTHLLNKEKEEEGEEEAHCLAVSLCTDVSGGKLKVNWDVSSCMKGRFLRCPWNERKCVPVQRTAIYWYYSALRMLIISQCPSHNRRPREVPDRCWCWCVSLKQTTASSAVFHLSVSLPLGFCCILLFWQSL